jgi:hypothetical protein
MHFGSVWDGCERHHDVAAAGPTVPVVTGQDNSAKGRRGLIGSVARLETG